MKMTDWHKPPDDTLVAVIYKCPVCHTIRMVAPTRGYSCCDRRFCLLINTFVEQVEVDYPRRTSRQCIRCEKALPSGATAWAVYECPDCHADADKVKFEEGGVANGS